MNTQHFSENREEMSLHADIVQRMAERLLKYAAELRRECQTLAQRESRTKRVESDQLPGRAFRAAEKGKGRYFS